MSVSDATVTLFRPVGAKELRLIEASGSLAFPPRLPEQPIFYPVTSEAYATQIARDWNTEFDDKRGFVTRFEVRKSFLDRYLRKIVGARVHEVCRIPAEDLDEFNRHIVGASMRSRASPRRTGSRSNKRRKPETWNELRSSIGRAATYGLAA